MSDSQLQFTAFESEIVARAANAGVTRRRIWYSILVPLALIAMALGLFWRDAQPRMLLWMFVAYIAINMLEKVGYGFAVLSYKSVICKLVSRVDELQPQPPPAAH